MNFFTLGLPKSKANGRFIHLKLFLSLFPICLECYSMLSSVLFMKILGPVPNIMLWGTNIHRYSFTSVPISLFCFLLILHI